jgi:transaldolase
MTKLHDLAAAGTSPWLDNIRRSWLSSGEFRRLLDDGVVGVTSNPTIFQKAIADSDDYDDAVRGLA